MIPNRIVFLGALCNLVLAGCYTNHLYVQQEWIDRCTLASSHVGTPDPRQAHPPHGQKLLISWDFPKSLFLENLTLAVTVRLWNNTQETTYYSIGRRRDYLSLFFSHEKPDTKILTYKVEVFSEDGKEVSVWKHQFWTELIDIDRTNAP